MLPFSFSCSSAWGQSGFDLVIQGGRIIDGSGNPWYVADVGIREGRIVAVGYFDASGARQVIDANGLVVAPGFIDVHTHVEGTVEEFQPQTIFFSME